jgi:hypothetical protein
VMQMVKQVEYDYVNSTSNLVDNYVHEDSFIYNEKIISFERNKIFFHANICILFDKKRSRNLIIIRTFSSFVSSHNDGSSTVMIRSTTLTTRSGCTKTIAITIT